MTSAELDVTEQNWLSNSLLALPASELILQEQTGCAVTFHHIRFPLVPQPRRTVPGRWLSHRWVTALLKYWDCENQEKRLFCNDFVLSKPCLISLLCLSCGISKGNMKNIFLQTSTALNLGPFNSNCCSSEAYRMVVSTVKYRVAPSSEGIVSIGKYSLSSNNFNLLDVCLWQKESSSSILSSYSQTWGFLAN